jgi:RimJ/RimL family protein N-acetyltransferase
MSWRKERIHSLFQPEILESYMISGKKIRLRKKTLADARDDYAWHADPELAGLDASPLVTTPFPQYLSAYLGELRFPPAAKFSFAIETLDGIHIGNCSYYDINDAKGEAEVGIMIGNRDHWNKGYGSDAITTLLDYVFSKTNLKRIYLKSLTSNRRAHRCFEKCGFSFCGHLSRDQYNFVLMDIHRHQWQKRQTET